MMRGTTTHGTMEWIACTRHHSFGFSASRSEQRTPQEHGGGELVTMWSYAGPVRACYVFLFFHHTAKRKTM